uniref:Secreted protein n=1 Tax=Eutreptiella gymnastica TaxID=73025 RepID=A0A7S4CEV4_9EUGL
MKHQLTCSWRTAVIGLTMQLLLIKQSQTPPWGCPGMRVWRRKNTSTFQPQAAMDVNHVQASVHILPSRKHTDHEQSHHASALQMQPSAALQKKKTGLLAEPKMVMQAFWG